LIKELAKTKVSDIKSNWTNERKRLIKVNAANLRANGHIDPLPDNREDEEDEEKEDEMEL
jgi:hypothetical protein